MTTNMNTYYNTPDRELTPPDYDNKEYPTIIVDLHNCLTCGHLSRSEFCNEFCHETYLT